MTEDVRSLLDALRKGNFEDPDEGGEAVRRKYELGVGSRIKDSKTGRVATHLDKFFKGRLELIA